MPFLYCSYDALNAVIIVAVVVALAVRHVADTSAQARSDLLGFCFSTWSEPAFGVSIDLYFSLYKHTYIHTHTRKYIYVRISNSTSNSSSNYVIFFYQTKSPHSVSLG